MTTNAAAPEMTIMLHNEMAYERSVPRHLFFFFCESAPGPGQGGETPIARSEGWHRELGEELIAKLDARGLRRVIRYPSRESGSRAPARSWQSHFASEDPARVERECQERGIRCEWEPDGSLTTWSAQSVTIQRSGRRLWFCSPQTTRPATSLEIRQGDGACLSPEVLERLRAVQWKIAVAFAWRASDVLCLDNILCQDGRLSHAPTADRRVFISMATPEIGSSRDRDSTACRTAHGVVARS
jgi:hypothetical protein